MFCDRLDDNFLVQHITTPTRGNAILDLFITDETDMVSDVEVIGMLSNSDHNAILCNVLVRTENVKKLRQTYDYNKPKRTIGTGNRKPIWMTYKN